MFEIKLCSVCARMNCTAGNHTADPFGRSTMRACQECAGYAPELEMVGLNDGRIVCGACAGRIRRMSSERAQLSLLDQQPLF